MITLYYFDILLKSVIANLAPIGMFLCIYFNKDFTIYEDTSSALLFGFQKQLVSGESDDS